LGRPRLYQSDTDPTQAGAKHCENSEVGRSAKPLLRRPFLPNPQVSELACRIFTRQSSRAAAAAVADKTEEGATELTTEDGYLGDAYQR
jgi:hypothetical protein